MPSRSPRWSRLAVVLGALVGLVVLTTGPAFAHAALRETVPFDGQQLDEAPDEVTLTFNEPVTAATGALRVFASDGSRVDTGGHRQLADDRLAVGLPGDLGSDGYVVTFRVTSADGHVIRGAFVFVVGDGTGVDDDTVAALFSGGTDAVLNTVAVVVRAVGYLALLLVGGAALWLRFVAAGRADEVASARRWLARAAVVGIAAALAAVPIQAMASSGLGTSALASGTVLAETAASSVGVAAVVRTAALVAVLLLLRTATGGTVVALAAVVALASFVLDGHTRTGDPPWLLWTADLVHLVAAAAWLGGLVLLAGALRRRRLDDDPVGGAAVVARFSTVATWSLAAVTLAGVAMSVALVRQPRALIGTDYGWTLLIKVGLVAVVILLGVYNNRRLVPLVVRRLAPAGGSTDTDLESSDRDAQLARAGWSQLAETVRFEAVVLALVVAVTAVLVNLRPAAEAAGITGAFDTTVPLTDELTVNLVVDPNRAGRNEIHLYVLDRTGRPVSDLDDVTLRLTQPSRDIGPIERETFVAGPGHWQLNGRDLAVPGEWVIEAVVGIDRFREERVEVPVVVNPS